MRAVFAVGALIYAFGAGLFADLAVALQVDGRPSAYYFIGVLAWIVCAIGFVGFGTFLAIALTYPKE